MSREKIERIVEDYNIFPDMSKYFRERKVEVTISLPEGTVEDLDEYIVLNTDYTTRDDAIKEAIENLIFQGEEEW